MSDIQNKAMRSKASENDGRDKGWTRPKVTIPPISTYSTYTPGRDLSDEKISPLFSSTSKAFSIEEIIKPRPITPQKGLVFRTEDRINALLSPKVFRVGIFLISIYSTVLSTIWFLIAVIKPHWGGFISNTSRLNPAMASILVAGFAKTIEMTFTSVMIVCLGQYLTNKAKKIGITVVDLQLRTMVLLPCALIMQKGGLRALWKSGLLGLLCIIAYLAATFVTTASDAVVSPRMSVTQPTTTNLTSYVHTSIANTFYIGQSCPNPPSSVQNINTCITTEYAGVSYRNYLQLLANWKNAINAGQTITDLNKPAPVATLSDNIAVQGQWLSEIDYVALSQGNGRLITGSQMAMPFAGVVNATMLPQNNLNKAANQRGTQLIVNAKSVTPVVGVMCAVVTAEELVPIVYMNWTHPDTGPMDASTFDNTYKNVTWRTNATVLDGLFQFNDTTRARPVFYKLPEIYNSEIDGEGTYRDMLYVLFNSNTSKTADGTDQQYTFCGMNFTLAGGCSTVYTANSSGTSLSLNCEKNNEMAFPQSQVQEVTAPWDWVNVAAVWGRSISLGTGITDGRAATAAILTQLAATDSSFDPTEPSLADSLAMLSGGTLLMSTTDTPFDGLWIYPEGGVNNILPQAASQQFQAKVQLSDYMSGTTNDWKNIFVIVLLLVMVLNYSCLGYLSYLTFGALSVTRRGMKRIPPNKIQDDVTDLREAFTTAISSPTVYIKDSHNSGSHIRWKYQDSVFRPSTMRQTSWSTNNSR